MLPIPLQNWLVGIYSEKIERERGGREYEEILHFLNTTEAWTLEQINSYKEEYTYRIIDQAYNHCPYYRKKYNEAGVTPSSFTCIDDLQKFPILTKEEIRVNMDGMIADNIKKKEVVHYHTSGTSGKSLDFYNTKYNLRYYWAVVARNRMRFGIEEGCRNLNFTGKLVVPINQVKPPYWRFKKAQNQYMLPMQHITKEKISSMVDFINNEDFVISVGYPSIVYSFALLADELGLKINKVPRFFFSGAEKVYDYQKEEIGKVFPGMEIVEHYGFSENAGAASKCIQGVYHEDFEFGHLELKDSVKNGDLETGILLSTGFHNFAMPFIRYEVGDTVTFDNRTCGCGLKTKIISEINGRNEDFIITPEGAHIMRFDYIFKDTHDIREAQVVQRQLGEIVIRVVRRNDFDKLSTEKMLTDEVHKMISPSINVKFEYVDEIERTKAGKFKAVVSELNKTM